MHRTRSDWLVLPDGSQTNAWRLLHATSKGGDRFCVGSYSRYTPGQADDAANKATKYQFESLHKMELNQPDSLLHIPTVQACCKMAATGALARLAKSTPLNWGRRSTF